MKPWGFKLAMNVPVPGDLSKTGLWSESRTSWNCGFDHQQHRSFYRKKLGITGQATISGRTQHVPTNKGSIHWVGFDTDTYQSDPICGFVGLFHLHVEPQVQTTLSH